MEKASVIIITKNEQLDIEGCLKSAAPVAAQVIVVDDFSTDETVKIAEQCGAEVHRRHWDGFGSQKQYALGLAKHEWILNLDADERLSPELQQELGKLLDSRPQANGYNVPFQHIFMGRRLRFGGCGGESHVRLFKKSKSSYPKKTVHESIEVEPPIDALQNPILHYSYKNLAEYFDKSNRYSSLIAQDRLKSGRRFSMLDHFRLPFEFFKRYLLQLGFLDGQAGFTYAALSAYYSWIKSLKLKELEG